MSAEATSHRTSPWEISSRVVVFSAVGAALYAVLGLFGVTIPGTQLVDVRVAFALVPFFGIRFGPIAGFFTGLVGNMIIDQIHGLGLLTYWNWSMCNGLTGLLAGIIWSLLPRIDKEALRLVAAAAVTWVATAVAFLFALTDIWLQGMAIGTFFSIAYGPLLLTNTITVLVLVPALDAIWEPLSRRIGR